jgi:phosphatidylglycerol---prolipoprotein diacylglyceryl transferase
MHNVFYITVDPVIFHLGPITLAWYGVMVALAVLFVIGWMLWRNSKKKTLENDVILTSALIAIPSGIIFSKLLHVIDQWGYYRDNIGQIFSGQGLTIWGAVLGATIGVWVYSRFSRRLRFGEFTDVIAPGIIAAQAIGRVGCTLNGCCYGIVDYHSPLAVIYTNNGSYAPKGIPVLPTQEFEIVYDLIVFGILMLLRNRLKPTGALFTVYFFLYGAWRFAIEFIRDGTPFVFGMHQAQFIGLLVMLITLPIIIFKVRWKGDQDGDQEETASNLTNADSN